jgi:hypothetical protein
VGIAEDDDALPIQAAELRPQRHFALALARGGIGHPLRRVLRLVPKRELLRRQRVNLSERRADRVAVRGVEPIRQRIGDRQAQRLPSLGILQRPVEGRLDVADEGPRWLAGAEQRL